jgi:hypothetical protein
MREETAGALNVTGKRMAMVPAGPIPGKTPMKVPIRVPIKQ